ncbi:MAG: hypothetical protein HXX17_09165 [Geobacteraceae bacterium]|nr:hypothetical protein [Geobacteraceae bacterium]
MSSFLESIFGYSPQMILSESPDRISLRSKSRSKFIVFLMLLLLQLLVLPLFIPIEQVVILMCVPIIGGLTYSKAFIFDRATFNVMVRRKMFGIGLNKEIKFDEIACVKAESNPLRKGTYLFLKLKNHKKLLLDMTTDKGYIDTVIDAINKVRNPTCH